MRNPEILPLTNESDIIFARREVRSRGSEIGLSLVDVTKLVTACSELARNTVVYGGGGTLTIEPLTNGVRKGLRLIFEDQGPGIANIDLALTDGYTSGTGMGLGLSGARRLCNEFDIHSEPGKGTRVTVAKWK